MDDQGVSNERLKSLEERISALEKTSTMLSVMVTERGTHLDFRFSVITTAMEELVSKQKEIADSQTWAMRLAASTLLSLIIAGVVIAFKVSP